MSYTHDRDITLEGWIVHTSQANAKGTIKEHRNPILESRCKSKRSGKAFKSGEEKAGSIKLIGRADTLPTEGFYD